ncbi:hypothetical protein DZ956_022440 [Pseudomonas aeruginosa]|uniref:plasmid replication protein, CyRepA1 family n=1 Tax=Pseudomonas aeruginosa TaxID=287 RepID=UPI000E31CA03|nr:plasmid replication protein, CyRepA1 family [Pseudomonas aeruginosa]NPZ19537.1 hypothetical protein [Pseudomonas aeruginosa]
MHNGNDQKSALARFYEERFRSDPYALVDFFDHDIAAAAADVGVKWSGLQRDITWDGNKTRPKGAASVTDKAHRGKVMAWASIKRADEFEYPFVNFTNNNPAFGKSSWSGFTALLELYREQGGTVANKKHDEWLKKQESERTKREAARKAAEEKARKAEALVQGERLAYESAWHCGGRHVYQYEAGGKIRDGFVELIGGEDGQAPYLVAKGISAVASRFQMKRMRDGHGYFTAVPLYNIDGLFLGVQRLYADKKMQGTGVKMDGAHCIIGDLEGADLVYASEGFATGASVWLAEQEAGNSVAVIVTFNVDNLKKVVAAYAKRMPELQIRNAVDNDQWKPDKGNAGVLAAFELARDCNSPALVPQFEALGAEAIAKFKADRKGPTDWNDYHLAFGLKATAKALRARSTVLKPYKDWFAYNLQRLQYSGVTAEKAARQAINAGMLLVPIKYSGEAVLKLVMDHLPDGPKVDRPKLRSFCQWLAKQKITKAAELRSFSPATLAKSNVQHLRIEGIRQAHGNVEIPAHLVHLIESIEGCIILRAPMGSGKTEKVIAPLIRDAAKGAYVAHRVSLLDDAAARLNRVTDSQGKPVRNRDGSYKTDGLVHHYKHVVATWMRDVSHLACCVNSITAPKFYNADERSWFTTVDTLCIDEAGQVISHMASGPVEGRVRVFDAMLDAVRDAKRVLLCDADANDNVVEFCELARPGEKITIIEVTGAADHIRVDHSDDETVWQVALDWISAGKRVLMANDSVESCKKLAAVIEDRQNEGEIAPVRLLLVHQGNKGEPEVAAFLRDPDGEAVKYDVLIYSPAISSGVSMTFGGAAHFDHHVGLFSGQTVSPSDAIQMLRRDRTARHYLVGLGHASAQRQTDSEALYRGMLQADEQTFGFEEVEGEVRFVRKKTAFDIAYLASITSENRARNDFANNFLLMLISEGYQVHRANLDDPERTKESRANREIGGALVFEKRMTLINSVETPDEETFARLNRQEVRSERESAQVDRFHMASQLGVTEPTIDDVAFYDDRGISRVVAMELLQSSEEQAKAYDQAQRKARVVLTQHRYKTSARAFLVKTFETLGLDRFTGDGEFTAQQCREVLAGIRADQVSLDLYNALKVGRLLPSLTAKACATTVVKSILERLGVSVAKRKTNGRNVFEIDADTWQFIVGYVERRKAIGVHSLATHDTATPYEPKTLEAPADAAAAPQVAPVGDRDTLQGDVRDLEEKYPLSLAEKIYAVAVRCSKPLGIPLAQVVGAFRRDIVESWVRPGADEWRIGFELESAARVMKKAGL